MGTPYGWFKRISTRIHIDQIIESFAVNCSFLERLEIQWDPETIRFNENSRKFVDHIRYFLIKYFNYLINNIIKKKIKVKM